MNDGIEFGKNKMILGFGQMELNGELKTNESIKLIMRNDFKIVGLSFGSTLTIYLWVLELCFQKIEIITN